VQGNGGGVHAGELGVVIVLERVIGLSIACDQVARGHGSQSRVGMVHVE